MLSGFIIRLKIPCVSVSPIKVKVVSPGIGFPLPPCMISSSLILLPHSPPPPSPSSRPTSSFSSYPSSYSASFSPSSSWPLLHLLPPPSPSSTSYSSFLSSTDLSMHSLISHVALFLRNCGFPSSASSLRPVVSLPVTPQLYLYLSLPLMQHKRVFFVLPFFRPLLFLR